MSLGTRIRQIVSIYVVLEDGSGRCVAEHVEIPDAVVVAEAFEDLGYRVVIDPPKFGLTQNTISWAATDDPPRAVPWRDYLEERAKHERTRDTWHELYDYTPPNSFVNGYEIWKVRDEDSK